MAVIFSYADAKLPFKGKTALKTFIPSIFIGEDKMVGNLTYVFCTDEYLLNINRQFLNHDFYTDIITFDLSEPGTDVIDGEIYMSVDRVKDNAVGLGLTFEEELLRVLFHGALHLCGYGDKTKREIALMRGKEDEYLRLYKKTI